VFRRLFQALAAPADRVPPSVPYAQKCSAGHEVRGFRQRRHQVVPCAACGARVFVLPCSPFAGRKGKRSHASPTGRSPWRRPAVAAGITLFIVAGALAALLLALTRNADEAAELERHRKAGYDALEEGKLRHAAEEFSAARQLALRHPDWLEPGQSRELNQIQGETNLLSDLLTESLSEILLRAARSPAEEWEAQFRRRYRGLAQPNAIVFDAEVRRDAAGQYHLDWHLEPPPGESARLEISDLTVLHALPLAEPRRLLFGARLSSIAREQNGVWVIRFEPASGVLLTDQQAVAAALNVPIDDSLVKLLEQQRKWVEQK
jgi:hypothetical protein